MAEFRTVYLKKANRYEAGLHPLSVSILGWDILYVVMGIIVVHQLLAIAALHCPTFSVEYSSSKSFTALPRRKHYIKQRLLFV